MYTALRMTIVSRLWRIIAVNFNKNIAKKE